VHAEGLLCVGDDFGRKPWVLWGAGPFENGVAVPDFVHRLVLRNPGEFIVVVGMDDVLEQVGIFADLENDECPGIAED